MKRDLEIIRSLLLAIEECDSPDIKTNDLLQDGDDIDVISYHLELLLDACYVDAKPLRVKGPAYPLYFSIRLTMQGHDYLDAVRNKSVWGKTKEKLSDFASSAPLDVVKAVGTKLVLEMINT